MKSDTTNTTTTRIALRKAVFDTIEMPNSICPDQIESEIIVQDHRYDATIYFRLCDRRVQLAIVDDDGGCYQLKINRAVLEWLRDKIRLVDEHCPLEPVATSKSA